MKKLLVLIALFSPSMIFADPPSGSLRATPPNVWPGPNPEEPAAPTKPTAPATPVTPTPTPTVCRIIDNGITIYNWCCTARSIYRFFCPSTPPATTPATPATPVRPYNPEDYEPRDLPPAAPPAEDASSIPSFLQYDCGLFDDLIPGVAWSSNVWLALDPYTETWGMAFADMPEMSLSPQQKEAFDTNLQNAADECTE